MKQDTDADTEEHSDVYSPARDAHDASRLSIPGPPEPRPGRRNQESPIADVLMGNQEVRIATSIPRSPLNPQDGDDGAREQQFAEYEDKLNRLGEVEHELAVRRASFAEEIGGFEDEADRLQDEVGRLKRTGSR